jgi:RHS repeat-associated protein
MNAVLINNTFHFVSSYNYIGTWHKYYFAGTTRVAMCTCSGNSGSACSAPTYFLSDHLGSTSVSVNNVGTMVSTMLYSPWGEVRSSTGTSATPYQYDGQFSNMSDFGLLFFNARWVDPVIGRFTSPDSIIPESQGVQAWDRYAFVNNNPLRYTDPNGHEAGSLCDRGYGGCSPVIFFGGSNPIDATLKGPSPYSQSPIWTTNQNGEPITEIPYPGGESAKADQASFAEGLLVDESVDLIGYSGGTEAALMYAVWRIENDQEVNSVTLLGPTFQTSTMNFSNPDGGWSAILDTLLNNGVDVLVIDDGWNPFDQNAASTYEPPSSATGSWTYKHPWIDHYSEHPIHLPGTNNNRELKRYVYYWME